MEVRLGSRVICIGPDGAERAAIVTRVHDAQAGEVNLHVFKRDKDDAIEENAESVARALEPDQAGSHFRWRWPQL